MGQKNWRYKINRLYNKLYASLFGYFWLSCKRCGRMYGGHEIGKGDIAIEKDCWGNTTKSWCCCMFCDP